jgi:hypothetical protein
MRLTVSHHGVLRRLAGLLITLACRDGNTG